MGVEKLLPAKIAKIKSRQEALQATFAGRLDIFYPPNFACLGPKGTFSTPTPGFDTYACKPQNSAPRVHHGGRGIYAAVAPQQGAGASVQRVHVVV